jgi:hypothetical protein
VKPIKPKPQTPMGFLKIPIPAQIADASARVHTKTIAEATFKLNQLRENWLNPPDWLDWVITPEEAKAGLAGQRASSPGQNRRRRLRLGRLHTGDA